ncbi:deoxynucleoside kinase [Sporanaerobium hydrogeniformans]|uniref:Deoxynucleoside kinase n=1 Tax=Sporanaerobium hydrogeniformans TaxID=3072179 RepID=A0AC61DJJ6_9FIRM|nr:deoxynucleoside kinase [Sporanaerobium hydrogeniformans]PHV72292.1 deoxynucleoside kinase [Sporanaerobium hydrogeniformans]
MLLVVGGMIGLGKSSMAALLGKHFNTEVFYENVDNNPILPLFYTATDEEIQKYRYPFLLQLHFLNSRFRSIKRALYDDNNILDRSIYEDWYFAKVNNELGRISDLEFRIYGELLDNMMEELKELPKKAPDMMLYLKGSFETVLDRIMARGRSYELDNSLVDYYKRLWLGYDEWVMKHYHASEVLIIDMDCYDIVSSQEDAKEVIALVEQKLEKIRQ